MKRVFEYLQSFTVVVLVLAAISGVSYHAFRDDGWVENVTGKIWSLEMQYPMIAIPATIAAILVFKMWHRERQARGRHHQLPNIVIYVLMAVGLYFIVQYFVRGSI
ncbi:MAG TPA: hypothetical protein VLN59_16195 [Burkholderiales bacterium]|nr:hypothetical protein [Burkholderiales bacterium]